MPVYRLLIKYDIEDIPQTFIPNGTKSYFYTKDDAHSKCLLIERYEILIYRFL